MRLSCLDSDPQLKVDSNTRMVTACVCVCVCACVCVKRFVKRLTLGLA